MRYFDGLVHTGAQSIPPSTMLPRATTLPSPTAVQKLVSDKPSVSKMPERLTQQMARAQQDMARGVGAPVLRQVFLTEAIDQSNIR